MQGIPNLGFLSQMASYDMFLTTYARALGRGMVFCNFHRMFTFLSLCFHLLVVHAFTAFTHPALFASAAGQTLNPKP